LRTIEFDYSHQGTRWLEEQFLMHRMYDTLSNPWPDLVTGNPAASILVVGERANPSLAEAGRPMLPFVQPGGSSRFITNVFHRMGIPESALTWVNAWSPNQVPAPAEVANNRRVVITLGQEAAAWAEALPEKPKTLIDVPHPAYWLRWRSQERYPLFAHGAYLRHTTRELW
jgi:hypothetical protein